MKNQNLCKKQPLMQIKNTLLIILGTAALSFANAVFMLPFDIVSGGISGLSIVLEKIIQSEIFSLEIIITALTWICFILGFFVLGRSFAVKTFISAITYPIFVSLFLKLVSSDFLKGYFDIANGEYAEIGVFISAIAGGALFGLGCALAFLGGGSTGGTDILAFIVCKFFPRQKSSFVIFVIDAIIVVLGMFVIGDFTISLLGILSAFVCAIVIDKVFIGAPRAFIANIISKNPEEINSEIIQKLGRTTTIVYTEGGFTGEKRKMIMFSFTISEYYDVLNIVQNIDKDAFITIHSAHEISGNGWTA